MLNLKSWSLKSRMVVLATLVVIVIAALGAIQFNSADTVKTKTAAAAELMAARRPSAAAVGSCRALAEHTMSARSSVLMAIAPTSQFVRRVGCPRRINLQRAR